MNRRAFLASLALAPGAALARRDAAVFVVHPYDTPSRVYARFRPLTLYLGGVLGRPLRLIIATTYDEQVEMIATGRADYAYIGPTPYVRARTRGDAKILAGEAESGQAFYPIFLCYPASQAQAARGKPVGGGFWDFTERILPTM